MAENNAANADRMLARLREEMGSQNTYPFVDSTFRNMVIVGRIRTGKSTIPNTIKDPFRIPEMPDLYAATRGITFNRMMTVHEDIPYYFTIIDSPGLFDIVINRGERLENETIQRYLDECITKDIPHIHAFAFVFSSGGGINYEDIKSMIFIKKQYPRLQPYFMLIITHCEEKSAAEREAYVAAFFQHPDVVKHDLRNFFGLGVHFMGCLRPELRINPNYEAARFQMNYILEMRQRLLDFIIQRQETYNIHHQQPPNLVTTIRTRFWSRPEFLYGCIIGGIIAIVFIKCLSKKTPRRFRIRNI